MNSSKTVVMLAGIAVVVLVAQAVIIGVLQWQSTTETASQTAVLDRIAGTLRRTAIDQQKEDSGDVTKQLSRTADKLDELLALMTEDEASASVTVGGKSMLEAAMLLSISSDYQVRSNAATILGRLGGEEAEQRLLAMAQDDPQTISQVIQALRGMGSSKAGKVVMDMLQNGTPEQMQNAANYLSGIMNRDMVPGILEVLKGISYGRNSRLTGVRRSIYGAIREIGDPRAADAMLAAVKQEMDDYGRRYAAGAFMACLSREDIDKVATILEILGPVTKNGDYSTHREVVQYLGQTGDYRATKYILPFLDSGNQYMQQTALQAVVQLRDPMAAEKILACLNSENAQISNTAKQYARNGFPGIREENGEYLPVPEEQMAKLMERRNAAVKSLEGDE